jgi:hypothetical protein
VIKNEELLPYVHSIMNAAEVAFIDGMQQSNQMHRIYTQTGGGNTAKCSDILKSEHAILSLYVAQPASVNVGMAKANRLKAAQTKQHNGGQKKRSQTASAISSPPTSSKRPRNDSQ